MIKDNSTSAFFRLGDCKNFIPIGENANLIWAVCWDTRKSKKVKIDTLRGLQEVEVSRIFRQPSHKRRQVVSPSHRPPLPFREDSWYSYRLIRRQGCSAVGKISQYKIKYPIGNQTRSLPACRAIPQPAALPRTPGTIFACYKRLSESQHIENLPKTQIPSRRSRLHFWEPGNKNCLCFFL